MKLKPLDYFPMTPEERIENTDQRLREAMQNFLRVIEAPRPPAVTRCCSPARRFTTHVEASANG